MRPTKPFMSLQTTGDLIENIAMLLPDNAEIDEHEHKGIRFIVHQHPIFDDEMWVATELTTGRTLTHSKRCATKDRAIQGFIDEVDKYDIDDLHSGLMNALLDLEKTPVMTVDEYLEEVEG